MLHLALSWLWDSALAQFGIAGLVLIAAIAVFLYVPLPGARHAAVAVATVCVIFLFLAPKLYIEGIRYAKAQCDAKEARAERAAENRDTQQETIAGQDATDQLALLKQQSDQDKRTIDALRANDQICHPITADQLR